MSAPYVCTGCRRSLLRSQLKNGAYRKWYTRPSFAPKPVLDLKHIRQAPGLYEQNCEDRNYKASARNSWKIFEFHEKITAQQREAVGIRQRSNAIGKEVQNAESARRKELLEEAKEVKAKLSVFETNEKEMHEEMERLALELPNLSSIYTPVGDEPQVLEQIGSRPNGSTKSHVEIGKELDILDFEASATTSGWGWYFLKNEGALLEQALIQYALSIAMKRGWKIMTPPSLVYSHIASACGFMPRDQNGETQIYEVGADQSNLVLAGTAEIPFAGSQANKTLLASDLPLKVIGPSRCYRAEAGARGVDTKGLYRVHEFTKVEMFAWTLPPPNSEDGGDHFGSIEEHDASSETIFEEMISIQKEILTSLGLHAKVLEMPTADLGASAIRKVDIEAFFPSRAGINEGYGEVTSASICTDYQSRRLATRLRTGKESKLTYPHTVNGTAMAVPRILACLIENHWDEEARVMRIPEVLRKFLPDGMGVIGLVDAEQKPAPATLIGPEGLHAGYTREHFHGRPGLEDGVVRERGE